MTPVQALVVLGVVLIMILAFIALYRFTQTMDLRGGGGFE